MLILPHFAVGKKKIRKYVNGPEPEHSSSLSTGDVGWPKTRGKDMTSERATNKLFIKNITNITSWLSGKDLGTKFFHVV